MGESKQGVMVGEIPTKRGGLMGKGRQNPVTLVLDKWKEGELPFKGWLEKQSLPVEATIATIYGATVGAIIGHLTARLITSVLAAKSCKLDSRSHRIVETLFGSFFRFPGTGMQFGVVIGVQHGISCVMKRMRGKDDVRTWMVAAFGSGVMYSLVSRMGQPNLAGVAITTGLILALLHGGFFQLRQMFSRPQAEDACYIKTRSILTNLGLQNFERNFKKGLLTDSTLPLLTDSALKDVKIPVGPRLLILDHIERPRAERKAERS